MSAGVRRRWLIWIAPWIGLIVACENIEPRRGCNINEDADLCATSIPQYTQNTEHAAESECRPAENSENVTVASGAESDSAQDRSCLDTTPDEDQVPAAAILDALRGARVEYASASPPKGPDADPFSDHMLFTCTYDIANLLPAEAPATCTGTTTWTLAAALRPNGSGSVPGQIQIAAQRIATEGEPEGSFDATVLLSCGEWSDPPNEAVPVPLDSGFRRVASLPSASVDCTVAVTLDSSAIAAGSTIHQLLVTARTARRQDCSSDDGCGGGDRCSSFSLECTSGLNGASCLSPYDPLTGNGDCSEEAPFCTPLGCSTGLAGRPCGIDATNASDLYCAEGFICDVGGGFPSCQPSAP